MSEAGLTLRATAPPRRVLGASWMLLCLSALGCFLLLARGALGPGRLWAFDRLAQGGAGMLLEAGPARLLDRIISGSQALAILWGILLLLAFLLQWVRTRAFPRSLGITVLFLGGANLCTQMLKSGLPYVLGTLGFPVRLPVGFPSGHTTMAVSLALSLLLLAPPRWRPWLAPVGGLGAALVSCALFLGGHHPPFDILGAVLLTLLGACLATKGLAAADVGEAPRGIERISALALAGLGLAGLFSGLLLCLSLDLTRPGPVGALAAAAAGGRMILGTVLLALGGVALRLSPSGGRARIRPWVLLVSLCLVLGLTDALLQSHWIHARERGPRAALDVGRLRLARLVHGGETLRATGDSMRWVLRGEIPPWEFLAGLDHQLRVVDQDLQAFAFLPMEGGEREAFARLGKDWSAFRAALEATALQFRQGPMARQEALEQLRGLQRETEASLSRLLELIRRTPTRSSPAPWASGRTSGLASR